MEKLDQIALIYSKVQSNWKSAKTIAANLNLAYSSCYGSSLRIFNLSQSVDASSTQLLALAHSIFNFRPKKLIFIDDVISPSKFLTLLSQVYEFRRLPSLHFHIYGNFTLNTAYWLELDSILKKTEVQFICASERQGKLVKKFLIEGKNHIRICPFPVDTKTYYYSPKLRDEYREKLQIQSNELVLLYTGRLSVQKNILRLTHEVANLIQKKGLNLRLIFAGNFDEIWMPYFKTRNKKLGTYYKQWIEILEQFNENVRNKISLLGFQDNTELNSLYSAADIFVSLSLYHDEDFGMSPAEASCCGLPLVLSDWGGFAGFTSLNSSCYLVATQLQTEGLHLSSKSFHQGITSQATDLSKFNLNQLRLERSRIAKQHLSIDAISHSLKENYSHKFFQFCGFNDLIHEQVKAFKKAIPFPQGPKKGTLYEKIYEAYLQET